MGDLIIDGEVYDSETGELKNIVEQVEAVVVENSLPAIVCNGGTHIQVNTLQLRKELAVYLEKYDIDVTEETEKDASRKATELNKLSGELDKARLRVAKEIKKPADELKKEIDGLIELIQGKRKNILDKVEVFKSKRFEYIKELLEVEVGLLYELHGVDDEYGKADIEKLVVESSLASVELTKKAKEALEAMVVKCKNTQNNVKIRLLELPLKCKELAVELTRDDVSRFLELDEVEYNNALDALILQRLEFERKVEENRLAREAAQAKAVQEIEEKKKVVEVKKQEEKGVRVVEVVATFAVEVPLHVTDAQVLEKYRSAIAEKFSTLKSMAVR